MRSTYADCFNHDEDADGYDQNVANEEDPIRTGYARALSWLGSQVPPGSSVLDLGTGTSNAIAALPGDCRVVAVDVSQYDTTSILRLIEMRWDLAPLSTRDASAGSLLNALSF